MVRAPLIAAATLVVVAFSGCETTSTSAPPVRAAMVRAAAREQVDEQTLIAGRELLLRRCTECHSLPVVSEHPRAEWPVILQRMSDRANLKPAQHAAVLAYILAAHG